MPPSSQSSTSFDSGTVSPQRRPAATSANKSGMTARSDHDNRISAVIRMKLVQMRFASGLSTEYCFVVWPISLDEIDVRLLKELQADADRPNVELARIVGLSPPATLNRVRRMKEAGVIRRIAARLGLRDRRLRGCRSTCWSRSRATTTRPSGASRRRSRAGEHHLGRPVAGRDRRDPDARRARRRRAARRRSRACPRAGVRSG